MDRAQCGDERVAMLAADLAVFVPVPFEAHMCIPEVIDVDAIASATKASAVLPDPPCFKMFDPRL